MTPEETEWLIRGREGNYNYLLIVFDIADKDHFPMFFQFYSDVIRYKENIISETKVKVIKEIRIHYV